MLNTRSLSGNAGRLHLANNLRYLSRSLSLVRRCVQPMPDLIILMAAPVWLMAGRNESGG
jgi:hypothetical protein